MKSLFTFLAFLVTTLASAQEKKHSLLVVNKMEATLSIIDPQTKAAIAKIPTGEGPHEVVASSDGRLAIVGNYGHQKPGTSLSVIDLDQKKEIKRIDLGPFIRPHGMVEKDGKIFFTSEGSRTVGCYDIKEDKISWIQGTGESIGHMVAVTADLKNVYVTNILSHSVTWLRYMSPPTPENIRQIPVGQKPEALEITPDGKKLWVGSNDEGTISIIDMATNKVEATFPVGQTPIRIRFVNDGREAVITDPKAAELIVVDVKSKAVTRRIKVEGIPVGILLTPDGQRLYMASMQVNQVFVFDARTYELIDRIPTGDGPDGMAWALR